MNSTTAAKALGWFSIGLGVTELMAPGWLQKKLGVSNHGFLTRAFGLREIASGVGILRQPASAGWVWSRVAGDAMDLAALFKANQESEKRGMVDFSIAMVAGIAALDAIVAMKLQKEEQLDGAGEQPEAALPNSRAQNRQAQPSAA